MSYDGTTLSDVVRSVNTAYDLMAAVCLAVVIST